MDYNYSLKHSLIVFCFLNKKSEFWLMTNLLTTSAKFLTQIKMLQNQFNRSSGDCNRTLNVSVLRVRSHCDLNVFYNVRDRVMYCAYM